MKYPSALFGEPYVAIRSQLDWNVTKPIAESHAAWRAQCGNRAAGNRLGAIRTGTQDCQSVTVSSTYRDFPQNDEMSGAEWDLDEVVRTQDWSLLELEEPDFANIPHTEDLKSSGNGTLVVWRELDRALAGESDPVQRLQDLIDGGRDHIALVFHRFLEGSNPRVCISINRARIVPVDPFLRQRKGRQSLPTEQLLVENEIVSVEPHILPHASRLSAADILLAGGADGLRKNQGFLLSIGMSDLIPGEPGSDSRNRRRLPNSQE